MSALRRFRHRITRLGRHHLGTNRLYETSDGGATWAPVTNLPAEAPGAVCGLSVVNESVVYA
jgi:hypothetical protein